ncbi:MAG: ABC transporter permease [Acidimicrobiia bacterium]|nr:ABC transporter permease [Acidimicrobiia bacterium]
MEATLASIVAAASALVYAVVGETIAEKAGVINLSLDGSIMLSAMAGFATAFTTGSVLLGFVAGAGVSMAVALLIAFASIELRLNQIAVGFVLTLLCTDLASFLGDPYVGQRFAGVPPLAIPGLADIPWLGPIFFKHNLSVYGSFLAVALAYFFIFRSRRGLELQGVGERPEAAHARGIRVNLLRYVYTVVGGALVGIAGASYSLDVRLGWRDGLTTNYGWIALAIVIFGGWHPVRAAGGAYLFGALSVLALKLQPHLPDLAQILPMTPFALMIFALLLVSQDWSRRLGDRYPRWRRLLSGDPPTAIGTAFWRD